MKKVIPIVLVIALLISVGSLLYFSSKDESTEKEEDIVESIDVEELLLESIKTDNLSDFIKILDENSISFLKTIDGNNFLHLASVYNSYDIAEYLVVENDFDKTLANEQGNTALELCIKNSSKEVFDLLVGYQSIYGNKLLYYALLNDDDHYYITLLDNGVKFDDDSIELLKNDKELYELVKNSLDEQRQDELEELIKDDSTLVDNDIPSSNSPDYSYPPILNRPTLPTYPIDPVDPVDPIDPVDPVDPIDPVDPEDDVTITITSVPDDMVRAMETYSYLVTVDTNSTTDISFSAINLPDFLVIDTETGELTGKPEYTDKKIYTGIEITATTDGVSDTIIFDLLVDDSFIELAMIDEDYVKNNIDTSDIIERLEFNKTNQQNICVDVGSKIFGENYESFNFDGGNANWINPLKSYNPSHIDLVSNNSQQYVMAGEFDNEVKYAVSGIRIFDRTSGNYLYESDFAVNVVDYLTDTNDFFTSGKTIYTNQKNDVVQYLSDKGISYNVVITDVFSNDVDFIYSLGPTVEIVESAKQNNIPIFAAYQIWWKNNESYKMFDIANISYPSVSTVNNFDSFDEQCNKSYRLLRLIDTLDNNKLDLVNKSESCSSFTYKFTCDFNKLKNTDGSSLNYLLGFESYRTLNYFKDLDYRGLNVYKLGNEYEHLKLAGLLGDIYRDSVSYDMNHFDGDDNEFYRAFYADLSINYSRGNPKPQNDLGTFEPIDLTKIDTMTEQTGTVTIDPLELTDWALTGYYLAPGQTMTIKRTDNSATQTLMHLNMQRIGSSRIWDAGDSYVRPYLLRSNSLELKNGVEYTYSSPHGGNIYIEVRGAKDESDLTFELSGVLSYPVLTEFDNTAITNYIEEIKTTPFAYTDIESEYVSIHSLTSEMIKAFDAYSGREVEYIEEISDYLVNNNLKYAGYENKAVWTLDDDVVDYFTNRGLSDYNNQSIHKLPRKQHINVDKKVFCANFCAGNPFDTPNYVKPFGYEDNHEMGHNLQTNRLNIYGGRSSESSNNIFPHINRRTLAIDNGDTRYEAFMDYADMASRLNQSYLNGEQPTINSWMWYQTGPYDNRRNRERVYYQLAFATNDWNVFPKLYITDRLFTEYIKQESVWEEKKNALGFSSYSWSEAKQINSNDFMVIVTSEIANKDLSKFYEGMLIQVSDKAKQQISLSAYPEQLNPGLYYVDYDTTTKTVPIELPTIFIEFGESFDYSK